MWQPGRWTIAHSTVAAGLSAIAATAVALAAAVVDWRIALNQPERLWDLHVYINAIRHADRVGSLYTFDDGGGLGYTYPPISADLLRPLTWSSATVVDHGWTILMLVSVAAVALASMLTVRERLTRWPWAAAAGMLSLAILLQSIQVQMGFSTGNISVLLIAICLMDAGGLVPSRFRGLLVGLAAAIKLTPLIFIPFFVVTRQWGSALRSSLLFVALTLTGVLLRPTDSHTYWLEKIMDTTRIGQRQWNGNQSITGLLARAGVTGIPFTLAFFTVAAVAGAGALFWAYRLYSRGEVIEAAVVVGCASVVASPISWPFHAIWLPLAGVLLLLRLRPYPVLLGVAVLIPCLLWVRVLDVTHGEPLVGALARNWPLLCCLAICLFGLPIRRVGSSAAKGLAPRIRNDSVEGSR